MPPAQLIKDYNAYWEQKRTTSITREALFAAGYQFSYEDVMWYLAQNVTNKRYTTEPHEPYIDVSPTPGCSGYSIINKLKCISYLWLLPAHGLAWNWLTVMCMSVFIICSFFAINRIIPFVKRYMGNNKRFTFPLLDMLVWSLIIDWFACVFMATAYVDGWGYFNRLPVASYLGTYCVAYPFFPLGANLKQLQWLQKSYFDTKAPIGTISKGYGILCITIAALFGLFAFPGFFIFGQILGVEFGKDPNTPLGNAGNWLVVAMWSGIVVIGIFGVTPAIYVRYKNRRISDHPKKETRKIGWMVAWNLITIGIAIMNIVQMTLWTALPYDSPIEGSPYKGDPLLNNDSTLWQLTWGRIYEMALVIAGFVLLGAEANEIFPLENIWGPIFGINREMELTSTTKNTSEGTSRSPREMEMDSAGAGSSPERKRRTDYSRRSTFSKDSAV